ncbi:hypothetical protein [Lactiplantibacillus plantarum]|uniref:hypothetical protein n=2 Tax=Bacillati TaxID=1783272 RepID=UPI0011C7F540|nr:hypothetical protein [Lactiplantibacillus plantarum]MCW6147759.1 hypothetical protein [Lactiplantibacillus plantarum]TXJ64546.1 hypothetical protein FGO87_15610 [Lactiplantibacillus plantarum]TXJ68752.1 hypothetical protein FGO88_15615 [Lactiplantibacillus plantarum]TXJ89757.1 hypothetical protein FFV23_15585 [Lactiplantibacillus plantarum]
MKVYHRGPLEVDQFNSSKEQAKKLGIIRYRGHWYFPTLRGDQEVLTGDWIVNKSNAGTCIMTDEEFKQQYVRLPVINKEVADWIKLGKSKEIGLDTALMLLMAGRVGVPEVTNVSKWIWHYHMADIAIAWAIGYQVEEDK